MLNSLSRGLASGLNTPTLPLAYNKSATRVPARGRISRIGSWLGIVVVNRVIMDAEGESWRIVMEFDLFS